MAVDPLSFGSNTNRLYDSRSSITKPLPLYTLDAYSFTSLLFSLMEVPWEVLKAATPSTSCTTFVKTPPLPPPSFYALRQASRPVQDCLPTGCVPNHRKGKGRRCGQPLGQALRAAKKVSGDLLRSSVVVRDFRYEAA